MLERAWNGLANAAENWKMPDTSYGDPEHLLSLTIPTFISDPYRDFIKPIKTYFNNVCCFCFDFVFFAHGVYYSQLGGHSMRVLVSQITDKYP